MSDDYLWDPSSPPDPEVERLERALARYRYTPDAGAPRWQRTPRALRPWLVAGGLAAALVLAAVWLARAGEPAAYRIEGLPERRSIAVGEELELAPGASANLRIGTLGDLSVAGGSRLRVEAIGAEEHRLYLERGRVEARIAALPRVFQIGTPAGRAVDLGCAYVLEVDESGAARVRVTEGQIEFAFDGREVYVPANAVCRSDPRSGPSWPEFERKGGPLDDFLAVARGEKELTGKVEPATMVAELLAECSSEDTLTLWHVFADERVEGWLRDLVLERLRREFPLPRGVDAAGLAARDAAQLRAWRDSMRPAWYVRRG